MRWLTLPEGKKLPGGEFIEGLDDDEIDPLAHCDGDNVAYAFDGVRGRGGGITANAALYGAAGAILPTG